MRSASRAATRTTALAAAVTAALALAACGDDSGDDNSPTFTAPETTETTEAETTGSTTEETSETSAENSLESSAPGSVGASESASADDEPTEAAASGDSTGDVEITVTAPEDSGFGKDTIIKTGQTTYEMTGDYPTYDYMEELPAVGWQPNGELQDCSTTVTYSSEDATEIAQYRTQSCDNSVSEGDSSSDYEWLDRGPLPKQGSEAPITITVEIESGGDTVEGETTISLRNPNNYR
ncbi:MAG: hypothetical protein ACTH1D_04515 [Mycobacteriaceae bacterium]|uniref:hypothetical protein n=1 Tax=Corynebacterium sp. TaxID=1720 RepID=UPI003F9C5951